MNAMRSPVGDHAAWPSFSPQLVSCRGPPPKVDNSHRLDALLLSSMLNRVSAHTACAPSGDSDTPPMRSIFQMSSTLRFFFFVMAMRPFAADDAADEKFSAAF